VVDQKQNGGTWVRLGAYSFTPSSGHKVELLGANDGRVVADGIRLVSASAQAANIAYIHSDHLGSPQKMTDTSQAVTWDAQFDPFGEEFLKSGSAVQPNRFPGQYADAETGYSYNYFRDYDPTIGRYLQSDPIGLAGGYNVFAYSLANPIRFSDPTGRLAKLWNLCRLVPGLCLPPNACIGPANPTWEEDQTEEEKAAAAAEAERQRCKEADDSCYDKCKHLMSADTGDPYRVCWRSCMKSRGCYTGEGATGD
jgi:RHS repeat-associated protein